MCTSSIRLEIYLDKTRNVWTWAACFSRGPYALSSCIKFNSLNWHLSHPVAVQTEMRRLMHMRWLSSEWLSDESLTLHSAAVVQNQPAVLAGYSGGDLQIV